MTRVDFTFTSGRKVTTTEAQARLLKRLGKGDYLTRDMADQPVLVKVAERAFPRTDDMRTVADVDAHIKSANDLNSLDREQLHALARERGLKVHHLAGADKVRAALREAGA